MKNRYGFGKTVATTFDAAIEKVTQELQKEGFGILTQIDVAATLKNKLNHDIPPYRVLGACNPPFAMRALTAEPTAGLLLPCGGAAGHRGQSACRVHGSGHHARADDQCRCWPGCLGGARKIAARDWRFVTECHV